MDRVDSLVTPASRVLELQDLVAILVIQHQDLADLVLHLDYRAIPV